MKKKSIDHTQLLLLKLVLHGMERAGYVEAYEKAAPTGRVRKYYHLTRAGRAALTEEEASWREYSGAVNAVLHFA